VAAFLSAKLAYSVSDAARRFRAEKHIEGRLTFLRVSGDLDAAFPAEKVAEGLEGQVVIDLGGAGKIDPAGAAAWRGFMATLSTTCEQVWLVAVPPVFLERLTRAEDLGRAQVLSLTMPYTCSKCSATASHPIDVEQHFDVLKFATPPEARCPDCGSPAVCAASEALLAHLGALSRPTVPPETRKLIAVERERKPAPRLAPAATAPPPRRALGTVLLASAAAAVVAVAVVLGIGWLRPGAAVTATRVPASWWRAARRSGRPGSARIAPAMPAAPMRPARASRVPARRPMPPASRPPAPRPPPRRSMRSSSASAWASRTPTGNGWSPRTTGRPGSDRSPARPPTPPPARRAVADALRATAPVVLAQPAAEYSERYRAPGGERILTFVRYDVAPSEIDALRARYTATTEVLGARAWTVFPALAWRAGSLRGGAQLVAVGDGPLRAAGLAPQDIILEVEGRPIATAEAFAAALATEHERLARTGGALSLLVKSGDAEPRAFNVAVARVEAPAARPIRTGTPAAPPGGGVNVWDRTGGGQSRDDPNQ
jgi:DNA-directed RNA polymerase subunit RPC12/RpoP